MLEEKLISQKYFFRNKGFRKNLTTEKQNGILKLDSNK
jgi:hypothetical protein